MAISQSARRKFLTSVAATGAAAVIETRLAPLVRAQAPVQPDLQGLHSKIDHIVVIFQENRSFDH
jgi:phospholipase C